jgi:hypothetical protein
MPNSLTYAGIPLCLDQPELDNHIDYYLSLENSRWTTPQRVYPGPRLIEIARQVHNVNRPKLALGDWWYPVGMSRWSELHLVTTDDFYSQLVSAGFDSGGNPKANPLTFLQNGVTISSNMYILDIRPMGKMPSKPGCYIITFVDERYWFNFTPISLQITESTKWEDVINDVISGLGISGSFDSVPAAYLSPEPNSDLQARNENSAIVADAVAFNVGMRWVRNLNGSYKLQTAGSAKSTVNANIQNYWLAGGNSLTQNTKLVNGVLPGKTKVSYPKWCTCTGDYINPMHGHIPYWKNIGDEYAVDSNLSQFLPYQGFNATKVWHDTAKAIYDNPTDSDPKNKQQLTDLAQQISTDYYAWLNDGIDQSFPLLAWAAGVEGFHDVCWHWARDGVITRVQHLPWNYGPEEMQHHTQGVGSASSSSGSSVSSASGASGSGPSGSAPASGSAAVPSGSGNCYQVAVDVDLANCQVTYQTWCFSADGRLISVT